MPNPLNPLSNHAVRHEPDDLEVALMSYRNLQLSFELTAVFQCERATQQQLHSLTSGLFRLCDVFRGLVWLRS